MFHLFSTAGAFLEAYLKVMQHFSRRTKLFATQRRPKQEVAALRCGGTITRRCIESVVVTPPGEAIDSPSATLQYGHRERWPANLSRR